LFYFILIHSVLVCFSCSSGAAPQHGLAAPDGALESFYKKVISFYLNCASGATPQQGVATPEGAPALFNIIIMIYFYKFELCIRCRSTTWSQGTRQGTRLFGENFI
jgi:hypothetical protein